MSQTVPHDLEARLASLEADSKEIKASLQRLEPMLTRMDASSRTMERDVSELRGRVSQLPTTMNVFVYMGSLVALVCAVIGLTLGFLKSAGH